MDSKMLETKNSRLMLSSKLSVIAKNQDLIKNKKLHDY